MYKIQYKHIYYALKNKKNFHGGRHICIKYMNYYTIKTKKKRQVKEAAILIFSMNAHEIHVRKSSVHGVPNFQLEDNGYKFTPSPIFNNRNCSAVSDHGHFRVFRTRSCFNIDVSYTMRCDGRMLPQRYV